MDGYTYGLIHYLISLWDCRTFADNKLYALQSFMILIALANRGYMCTCMMKDDSGEDYLTSQTFTEEMLNTQVGTDTMKCSNSDADSLFVHTEAGE